MGMNETRMTHRDWKFGWTLPLLAAVACLVARPAVASEFTLSDFNNSPFSWTFGGFQQTSGPIALRLTSSSDGWGGAGRAVTDLDLSAFADGRVVIDYIPESHNLADGFLFQLIDVNDRSRLFGFTIPDQELGNPVQAVSRTVLGDVSAGGGEAFDLSRIKTWQIMSSVSAARPFSVVFDNLNLSTTAVAPPPYTGYEEDAPWRTEAAQRIDQIRKADLSLKVVDAAGVPVAGAKVHASMQRHEFGFGSVVRPSVVNGSGASNAAYRDKITELFNIATVGDLKWHPWEGGWGTSFNSTNALAALNWLKSEGLETRGHVIVWPGYDNLPPDVRAMLDANPVDTERLRNRIETHIADIVSRTSGLIDFWDVVNEPRTNNDVMDVLPEGNAAMADWFQLTRANNSVPDLFVNEYSIVASGGDIQSSAQQELYDTVAELQGNDAPIGGIGIQAHFNTSSLSGPTEVWAILDQFADLELPVQITEFTYNTDDEDLQGRFTRDFLTAVFAHEGVSDFVMWGFWEGAIGSERNALFRMDWSPKPNGQAFLDLVFDQWWTDEMREVGADGLAALRAFKGEYDLTASWGDFETTSAAILSEDGLEVTLALSMLVGDYDRNGTVDDQDLVVWLGSLGGFVPAGTGADGNGDGTIDGADFLAWQRSWGNRLAEASSAAIPEPGTATLGGLLVALLGFWRRR
jgi:GH35 family endo-1,4-beta-xylanase